jgi:imidazolonepropionase-like amidohydrolase
MGTIRRRDFVAWLATGAAVAGGAGYALLGGRSADAAGAAGDVTVLTNATLIDGTGTPPAPHSTVVLAGDRIIAAGRLPAVPTGMRVIDLAGKYVIPGLWDLHTHSAFFETTIPQLHVVHGVTGVREMWGMPYTHDTRDRVESGELLGPRIVIGSAVIDGPPGVWDGATIVATKAEARAAVRAEQAAGAEFVKVYSFLAPEVYAAVADEADRVGLRFAGHVPTRVPVYDAVERGQYTHEHLYNLFTSTATDAADRYAMLNALPDDPNDPNWWGNRARTLERESVAAHDPAAADALFARMAECGIWQSPTLLVERRMSNDPDTITGDPVLADLLRYIPIDLREQWRATMTNRPHRTPEEVAELLAFGDARMRLLARMADAGVNVVAGTDAGFTYTFPGVDLHEELKLLVRAGFSPMRALQAATRDAARCVGLGDVSGTVTPGKHADLVVLDADPLADIGNTTKIHAVVARGRYLDGAERTRILAEIEEAAAVPIEDAAPAGGCWH